MKKGVIVGLVLSLAFNLALAGCTEKAASSRAVIKVSKTLKTSQKKIDYLIQQAKAFYSSNEFQETVNVLQYLLTTLDANSKEGKSLLEKAKSELAALTKAEKVKRETLSK